MEIKIKEKFNEIYIYSKNVKDFVNPYKIRIEDNSTFFRKKIKVIYEDKNIIITEIIDIDCDFVKYEGRNTFIHKYYLLITNDACPKLKEKFINFINKIANYVKEM